METTKFIDESTPGPLLRSQAIIYGLTALVSVGLLVLGGMSWWQHRNDPPAQVDPNSFRGGLNQIFSLWKRDVWDRPQATPAPTAQPTQAAPLSAIQAPAATTTPTPYQATDAQMAEWRHVPPGQEEHYAEYQRRLAAQQPPPAAVQPSPFPTPYLAPEAMPDPMAARHAQWQSLHDAYVQQVKTRLAAATTNEQKGQIQRDIATWKAANPEPPKPTTGDEIPIK